MWGVLPRIITVVAQLGTGIYGFTSNGKLGSSIKAIMKASREKALRNCVWHENQANKKMRMKQYRMKQEQINFSLVYIAILKTESTKHRFLMV